MDIPQNLLCIKSTELFIITACGDTASCYNLKIENKMYVCNIPITKKY